MSRHRREMTRAEGRAILRSYVSDAELLKTCREYIYYFDDSTAEMCELICYYSPADICFNQVMMVGDTQSKGLAPDDWDVTPEEWRLQGV